MLFVPFPYFFHFPKYISLDLLKKHLKWDFSSEKKKRKSINFHSTSMRVSIYSSWFHWFLLLLIRLIIVHTKKCSSTGHQVQIYLKDIFTGQRTCGRYRGNILKMEQCLLKNFKLIKVDTFQDKLKILCMYLQIRIFNGRFLCSVKLTVNLPHTGCSSQLAL